jgi:hypothetical protein
MTNATQAPIPVRFACGLYDRMLPLYTGDVKPRGIDLQFHAIDDPRVIFDRMAADQAFDACEMSSSEFISRKSRFFRIGDFLRQLHLRSLLLFFFNAI